MAFAINSLLPDRPATVYPCYCGYLHTVKKLDSQQKFSVVRTALLLLSSLLIPELAIAVWSHSLALLADAGHLVADIVAMGITLLAVWFTQRPSPDRATFGHQRLEILAALANGLGLLVVAALITWESIERFHTPAPVLGGPMLLGAVIGLSVNSFNLFLLYQPSQTDLNLKAAFLHVLADTVSAIGLIIASLIIYFWHWQRMDAIASLCVAGITALSALPLLQETLEVLLEYAPKSLSPEMVTAAILEFEGVQQVKQLRLWQLTTQEVVLSAEVVVNSGMDTSVRDRLLHQLQAQLQDRFQIQESTLQLVSDRPSGNLLLHPVFKQSLTSHVLGRTQRLDV